VTTCGPSKASSSEPPFDRRHPGCTDPGPLRGRPGEVALPRAALASSVGSLMGTLSLNHLRWLSGQRRHGCATWGVRAESGLGRSSPRLARREAPTTPRGVRRPLSPNCSASRSPQGAALPATTPRWRATSGGACGVMVRSAVVLRNRGDCRSRQETTLFCPRWANTLTSRQCSCSGRTVGRLRKRRPEGRPGWRRG
jgi:hypothetical protein